MIIKIQNTISFQDDPSGQYFESHNGGKVEWTYDGDSSDIESNHHGEVTKDFKITNANKYSWELKHGNSFDVNIQQDIVRGSEEISSLHVICYETTKTKPYRLPVRFDVVLDESDVVLASTCDFSLGNLKNLTQDIRINNIQVPLNSKVNLIIVVATKQF